MIDRKWNSKFPLMSKDHLWSKSLDQLTVSNFYISSSTRVFIYNYFQEYLSCTRIDVNCAVHEANGRRLHLHLSASKAQRTSRRYYRFEDDHDRAPLIIRSVNYSPRQNQIVLLFHKTSDFSYERRHRARTCRNSIVRLPLVKRARLHLHIRECARRKRKKLTNSFNKMIIDRST